jgi:D-arabinono-1,4-lactone oxidase
MRDMGAKPHWAKNFRTLGPSELGNAYGEDMDSWLKVRQEVDPDGMFLGEWHLRNLPLSRAPDSDELPLLEREQERRKMNMSGVGDGMEWVGDRRGQVESGHPTEMTYGFPESSSPASEESFDLLSKGEASILLPGPETSN